MRKAALIDKTDKPNEVARGGHIAFAFIEEDVALGVALLGAECDGIKRGALAAAGPAHDSQELAWRRKLHQNEGVCHIAVRMADIRLKVSMKKRWVVIVGMGMVAWMLGLAVHKDDSSSSEFCPRAPESSNMNAQGQEVRRRGE